MFYRISHDNSGVNPSWYFLKMQITDLQTNENFYFLENRWLAVEEEDGSVSGPSYLFAIIQ